jgi:hypothetical protein
MSCLGIDYPGLSGERFAIELDSVWPTGWSADFVLERKQKEDADQNHCTATKEDSQLLEC